MLRALPNLLLVVWCCALLSACQEIDVAHDLNQKQANEIVAVLAEQGISAHATRASGSRAQYLIQIPANNYSEAVSILHYQGLPKEQEQSVGDLLAPKGFLPNSRELENMRVDRAIAVEIENLLKTNPAVNDVKVLVRRPSFDAIGPTPPAHVSILIRKNIDSQIDREILFGLVRNMIPGLSADSLVIDVQDALPQASSKRQGTVRDETGKIVSVPMKEFLGWWRVAENDYDRMVVVLLCSVLAFLAVGLFVGFSAGFLGKKIVSAKQFENLPALKSDRSTLTIGSPEQ